jgi:hypothetical protein
MPPYRKKYVVSILRIDGQQFSKSIRYVYVKIIMANEKSVTEL